MASKITVLGSGSWGTALAEVVAHHAEEVILWGRDPQTVEAINSERENKRYLPEISLNPKVRATLDAEEAVAGAGLIVNGLPTKAIGPVIPKIRDWIAADVPVVSTSKGIDPQSLRFPSELLKEALGREDYSNLYVLSGPSFAEETAKKLPTAVVFAGTSMEEAERWGKLFFTPFLRTYPSVDRVGVEVAGAMKNVIALASGAVDGLGLGANGRSAMITRGLAEIQRLGRHFGADPLTFLGLAGMGDLVLTCTGGLSRNRRVGLMLAEGLSLEQALERLGQVAEGVRTTRSAKTIAEREGIDMPITGEVFSVLFEGKDARDAVRDLMARPMRPEI